MIFQNHMRQPLFSSIHQEKRRILRQKQYTKSEGVVFVPLIWCTVVFLYATQHPKQTGDFPTGLFVFYGAASKRYRPCSQDTIPP